jgi:hypothetical protein
VTNVKLARQTRPSCSQPALIYSLQADELLFSTPCKLQIYTLNVISLKKSLKIEQMNKKYCKALNLPPKKSLSSAEYFR